MSLNHPQTRRTALAHALAAAGTLAFAPTRVFSATALVIANVTKLYPVEVARIDAPTSARDVAVLITGWSGKVSIGGGRYSMGGQIALKGGLHLDMRAMNQLVWIRPRERTVRVQAGMRWRDLQDVIDPLNLAVKTMQSYSNFTVGGSVSVNVHGRYVGQGPISATVRALQLVLADGAIVETSVREHVELFRAAIGGYGAVGVITEVELDLAENTPIERVVAELSLERYIEYFERVVLNDKASVLHNADLLPPNFDTPVSVTWRKTTTSLTETARLVPRGKSYALEQNVIWLMTEMPGGSKLRQSIVHPLLNAKAIVKHLNHEASLDAAELEPRSRRDSTFVLQEYFVPKQHFLSFARELAKLLRRHAAGVLNVSIRHAAADKVSLLPWAKEDVYSFVIYFKQGTSASAQERVGRWTRRLIDLAISHEGRYYLPYQLHATRQQFEAAYPECPLFRRIKQRFDPASKFSNELWAKYL